MLKFCHREGAAAIGSMTAAMKAQHALQSRGIAARVIALSPGETRAGCAYGVSYPLSEEGRARAALQTAHIAVSQFFQRNADLP
jgi:hypothetical protein